MQQWRRRERHRQKLIITIRDLSNNRVFLIDPLNLLSVGDFSRVEFIKKDCIQVKKDKGKFILVCLRLPKTVALKLVVVVGLLEVEVQ